MIKQVAIQYLDAIYTLPPPARHYDVVPLITGDHKHYLFDEGVKGFITDDGKFLNRRDAAHHALLCGQITRLPVGIDLYSEMIF